MFDKWEEYLKRELETDYIPRFYYVSLRKNIERSGIGYFNKNKDIFRRAVKNLNDKIEESKRRDMMIDNFNNNTDIAYNNAALKLKNQKFEHWIDNTEAINKMVNLEQLEFIQNLNEYNFQKFQLKNGALIFIEVELDLVIYGCEGIGKFEIGYLEKGVTSNNGNIFIVTISGVKGYELTDDLIINKNQFTPTFVKNDFEKNSTNKKLLNKIFDIDIKTQM